MPARSIVRAAIVHAMFAPIVSATTVGIAIISRTAVIAIRVISETGNETGSACASQWAIGPRSLPYPSRNRNHATATSRT